MNQVMKNINYIFLFVVLGFISCDNFLDVAPQVNLDENKVFTNYVNAQAFQADIYSGLTQRFNAIGNYLPVPMSSASDESESNAGYFGTKPFNMGNYDGVDANIGFYYTAIRKANLFSKNSNRIPYPNELTRQKMLGEVHFLRAFYFNEMVKRFGGMPILDEKTGLFVPGDNLMR